jgi:hypothetical protein
MKSAGFNEMDPPLCGLAFMLPQVEILMLTKKPRSEELTWEQQRSNQVLNQRQLRSSTCTAV